MGGDGTIGGGKGSCRFKFEFNNGEPRHWVDHESPVEFDIRVKHPDLPGGTVDLPVNGQTKVFISWPWDRGKKVRRPRKGAAKRRHRARGGASRKR